MIEETLWDQWRHHPVTKAVMQLLQAKRQGTMEAWASQSLLQREQELLELGRIQTMNDLLNLTLDELQSHDT